VRSLKNIKGSLRLPAALRRYQWAGVHFLLKNKAALLCDEMGLGKTVQTVVAVRLLKRSRRCGRVLVVVPQSLRRNWEFEFRRWAPDLACRIVDGDKRYRRALYLLPIPVLICSYEQVRLDVEILGRDKIFDLIIVDEAQRIKNAKSATALACRMIPRDRAWALTGTPVENSPEDLVSILSFVRPAYVFSGMSRQQIHFLAKPFFLRRTKDLALKELPGIISQEIRLELEGDQLKAYQDAIRSTHKLLARGKDHVSYRQVFSLITKLKQLCNYDPASGQSAKLESLVVLLENMTGSNDKIIIFSQYVQTLKWLSIHLGDFAHDLFYGDMNPRRRSESLLRFQKTPGPRALLMSLRAGGVGLNLPEASAVLLFDHWWNPATENQAIQRAHRFGRTRPLHSISFMTINTIEERIETVLIRKKRIFGEYVTNAPTAMTPPLSKGELWRLLIAT
jgi:SNF2 family DNA or RNA helicase